MTSSPDSSQSPTRSFAVGVYLSGGENGEVELHLDDLLLLDRDRPSWGRWAYFTSLTFDEEGFHSHRLAEKEYAALGKAVAARLTALGALADEAPRG